MQTISMQQRLLQQDASMTFSSYLNEIKDQVTAILNTATANHDLNKHDLSDDKLLTYGVPAHLRWAIENQYKQSYFLQQLSQIIEKCESRISHSSLEYVETNEKDYKTHLILHAEVQHLQKIIPVSFDIYCFAIQRKYYIK